jgi:hypothetical protein
VFFIKGQAAMPALNFLKKASEAGPGLCISNSNP